MKQITLIFLLFILNLFGEEMRNYKPLKIERPPVIDGELTEDIWGKVEKVSGFIRTDKKPTIQQSYVMICYDEKNLYFGIECYEPNISQLVKNFTKHDDGIWADDCIEIFIAPNYLKRKNYYHFVVNCIGTRYDAEIGSTGRSNVGWSPYWEAKTKIGRDKWVVEILIPFSSIGLNVNKIDVLGISVCRERWAGEKEYTVWPIGGSFHKPDGHLIFTDYKKYLIKNVYPFWEKEKRDIYKYLSNKNLSKRYQKGIEQLIQPVELLKEEINKKEKITSEEFNNLLEKINQAREKMRILKDDIKFTDFLFRLENILKK